MKKKTASRKLKRKCLYCNGGFLKGNVYYIDRVVYYAGELIAYENVLCARCKYKKEEQAARFEIFRERCVHPEKFIHMQYSPMFGESILEPSHEECYLCYKNVNE